MTSKAREIRDEFKASQLELVTDEQKGKLVEIQGEEFFYSPIRCDKLEAAMGVAQVIFRQFENR